METQLMIVVTVVALVTSAIATLVGFGAATVMTPVLVLALKYDTPTAIAMVSVYHLANSIFKTTLFFKHIQWKPALTYGIASVVAAVPAALFFGSLNRYLLMFVLGVFLCGYSLYSLQTGVKQFFDQTPKNNVLGGLASGLVAGLIGTGGAIRGFFLSVSNLGKEQFVATMAVVALITDLSRVPLYLTSPVMQPMVSDKTGLMVLLGVMVIPGFVGTLLAKKLLYKITPEHFDRTVNWGLLVFGIYFVEKSIRDPFGPLIESWLHQMGVL